MKFLKSSLCIAAIAFLVGCNCQNSNRIVHLDRKEAGVTEQGDSYKYQYSYFRRANIDGVDCVIGSGRYVESGTTVSCDWASKDEGAL